MAETAWWRGRRGEWSVAVQLALMLLVAAGPAPDVQRRVRRLIPFIYRPGYGMNHD